MRLLLWKRRRDLRQARPRIRIMFNKLIINNLFVQIQNQEILKGVSLVLGQGEIHALMGPNGSGKSTLAKAIAGYPDYQALEGQLCFNSQDLLKLGPEQRAHRGLFLAFQYPVEVPGVNVLNFLHAINRRKISIDKFADNIAPILKSLHIKETFLERNLNEGFSGGEKKKLEILQMAVLHPKVVILDEIDSGLDIDALQTISSAIKKYRTPESIVLIITHYQRILKYIKPDFVHVMIDGRIAESGDWRLARRVEEQGYKKLNVKCQSPNNKSNPKSK